MEGNEEQALMNYAKSIDFFRSLQNEVLFHIHISQIIFQVIYYFTLKECCIYLPQQYGKCVHEAEVIHLSI